MKENHSGDYVNLTPKSFKICKLASRYLFFFFFASSFTLPSHCHTKVFLFLFSSLLPFQKQEHKIVTSVPATRICIHDQPGFIPTRHWNQNVHKTLNLIIAVHSINWVSCWAVAWRASRKQTIVFQQKQAPDSLSPFKEWSRFPFSSHTSFPLAEESLKDKFPG